MKIIQILLFFIISISSHLNAENAKSQPHFSIIVASYNNGSSNSQRCIANLKSIMAQNYKNYTAYITDDFSSDDNAVLIKNFIKENHLQDRVKVTYNKENKGPHANIYEMIHKLAPTEIIVILDGDDAFAHAKVLDRLFKEYSDRKIWLTYGNYKIIPGMRKGSRSKLIPDDIMKNRLVRSYKFSSSHLRTFYAKLYQNIKKEDLMWEGKFVPCSGDIAIMYPMLEMASQGHTKFINETLYLYYDANPLQLARTKRPLQLQIEKFIKAKPAYPALKKLF